MTYTVQKLATLAGVSVRTLHYYDQIGLLKPSSVMPNGYRLYGESELLRLQQVLFFRELDFPLLEIKQILSASHFDMRQALRDQKKLIELKKDRLDRLLKTIDQTIKKINRQKNMKDKELFDNLNKDEINRYTEEARARWGNTDAFKQSEERVKKMTKEDMARVLKEYDKIVEEIAAQMPHGPKSAITQRLIAKHYSWLGAFYEPNLELYRGLANMYVADNRFTAAFEKVAPGLALFMRDAMVAYCDAKENKR